MRNSDFGDGFSAQRLVTLAACLAVIFALQVAMAALPNIEVVSLLLLFYTRYFKRDALLIIYGFALLEGFFYGFGIWWFMYLYVWTILWAAVTLLRGIQTKWGWAMVLGFFGLCFGALCAIPYLFYGGISVAAGWWIAGIPYDLIHCVGNFALTVVLYDPLDRIFQALYRKAGV